MPLYSNVKLYLLFGSYSDIIIGVVRVCFQRGIPSEMSKHNFQALFLGPVVYTIAIVSTASAGADDAAERLSIIPGPHDVQLAQQGIEVPSRDARIRRGETVKNRERPELDPLGARLGTFLVFPRLVVQESYDDNIFAVDNGKESDFITRVRPGLKIQSDWNNHAVGFFGSGDIGRYVNNGDEDFEDFRLGATGRVDVLRSTNVRGRVSYEARHENRSSPDDVNGSQPTEFDVLSAGIVGFHNFGRVNVSLEGTFDQFDFDDVATSLGTIINNDDRDRDEIEGAVRVGYEIIPDYEAFVRGAYNIRDYDSDVGDDPANPLDRDSDGYDVVAGVRIDFGGITFGDFFAGYRSQDFDDPTLASVNGPTIGADITWNVTPLTTIVGGVSRVVRETTTTDSAGNNSSARFFTTAALSADHELLRNLLLGARLSASQDDFEGIERTDEIYRAGINATYMLNRHLYISGGYDFRMRNSDVSSQDFKDNVFFLTLRAQY